MKSRLFICLALLFCRVFVTPVCFGLHMANVKNPAEMFEQVRLKKRRSSFVEEEGFQEATAGILSTETVVKRIRLVLHNIRQHTQYLTGLIFSLNSGFTPTFTTLFLRNRVLRI